MKKLFSLLIALVICTTTYAQSEHLTFKGVPIDGSLREYIASMKEAGFTLINTEEDIATLQGDFAGYKNCKITVTTIKPMDLVNTINVAFPERDEWSELEGDYNLLKSMLQHKYGTPADCVEKFDMTSSYLDNSMKLTLLLMDECTWYTTFYTPNGDIKLSIEYKAPESFVQLSYYDRLNSNAVMQQAIDDL